MLFAAYVVKLIVYGALFAAAGGLVTLLLLLARDHAQGRIW